MNRNPENRESPLRADAIRLADGREIAIRLRDGRAWVEEREGGRVKLSPLTAWLGAYRGAGLRSAAVASLAAELGGELRRLARRLFGGRAIPAPRPDGAGTPAPIRHSAGG
jgi:hypothetical protein